MDESTSAAWKLPALLAALVFVALLRTVREPGLTIDEPINVGHGAVMKAAALGSLPETGARLIDRVWRSGHEHPPLTRFLLGMRFVPGPHRPKSDSDDTPDPERLVSAFFGAATVFLVAWRAGLIAGLALALLPRWFAHATIASPEVIAAFVMLLAWTTAADALYRGRGWWLAGLCLGLAGLCKLTAVLVPITLLPVVLWHLRGRSAPALAVWWGVAAAVFLVGWPWLWPVELPGYPPGFAGSFARLKEFLLTGANRMTIYAWYFGEQYAGNAAPWHYVWVWFFATLTPAALILGLLGLRAWWLGPADVRRTAVVAGWLGSMLFFTLPVHRYDSERLFLFAFPLWTIVTGWGAAALWRRNSGKALCAVLLAWAAWDCQRLAPLGLSYVSPLAGGLRGAERLGLELTYWGDSLTPEFLGRVRAAVPPGAIVELRPALFEGHTLGIRRQLFNARDDRTLVAAVPGHASAASFALVFRREGYLSAAERADAERHVVAEVARDGVWLARLVRLKP